MVAAAEVGRQGLCCTLSCTAVSGQDRNGKGVDDPTILRSFPLIADEFSFLTQ